MISHIYITYILITNKMNISEKKFLVDKSKIAEINFTNIGD